MALKNQLSNGMNKSSDHSGDSKTSGSVDGRIPEGELLLQVGEQQAIVLLSESVLFSVVSVLVHIQGGRRKS